MRQPGQASCATSAWQLRRRKQVSAFGAGDCNIGSRLVGCCASTEIVLDPLEYDTMEQLPIRQDLMWHCQFYCCSSKMDWHVPESKGQRFCKLCWTCAAENFGLLSSCNMHNFSENISSWSCALAYFAYCVLTALVCFRVGERYGAKWLCVSF